MLKHLRGWRTVIVLATALAVAVSGAAGWALAADPAGVIHACANKKTGAFRLARRSGACSKKEAAVSWNVQGVPGRNGTNGTNGQPGANGTNGTNGTNGKNGATNVTVRQGNPSVVTSGNTGTADVLCNLGEVATGGGDSTSASTFSVAQSMPLTTGGTLPTGWHVQAVNTGASTGQLTAVVICASP